MKHLILSLSLLIGILAIASCSKDDDVYDPESYYVSNPGTRTIIAYIMGNSNLSDYSSKGLPADFREMISGSKTLPENYRLIVFADFPGKNPFIVRMENGDSVRVKEFDNDFNSVDPQNMLTVFQWIAYHYPSEDYAAIMSGHGNGSTYTTDTVSTDIKRLYAYGGENYAIGKWINISSLAAVFSNIKTLNGAPLHFSNLFLDMCCAQNIETAYELRKYTDYIVAPTCETPGDGHNYVSALPCFTMHADSIAAALVDSYTAAVPRLCIAAIKTEHLEDLCQATKKALATLPTPVKLNRDHCTYYYRTSSYPTLYDMRHVMKNSLTEEAYDEWNDVFKKVIAKNYYATKWETAMGININFYTFSSYLNEETFGGINMFVPYDGLRNTSPDQIEASKYTEWGQAMDWTSLGW